MSEVPIKFIHGKEECANDEICSKIKIAVDRLRTVGVRVSDKWVLKVGVPKFYGALVHEDGSFALDIPFMACDAEGNCIPRGFMRVNFTKDLYVESVSYGLYYGVLEN